MKKWIVILGMLATAAAALAFFASSRSTEAVAYRFVTVERGNLDAMVSATGTLSAVTTVQVGTQVSGLIDQLLVDFNDRVEKGQVIARLDTTLLESSLKDAEAQLERSQAELRQAERELVRITSLHEQGIAALADYNKAQYTAEVARAAVKAAEASLQRARRNLQYATITAPVSGIVVERAVDVGQTVAASLSAPKLFTIANDLSEMQILSAVDESDIGRIHEGQPVRFTVKTYPDRRFTGTVKQVRLQSSVEQNVVTYPVVISVKNPDGALLPGMTATVEFLLASATDVLKVPNGALRFRPPEKLAAQARARLQKRLEAQRAARGEAPAGSEPPWPRGDARPHGTPGEGNPSRSLLYYLDEAGQLSAMPVRVGITDGQFTEVRGPFLQEGMQVIAGMTQAGAAAASNPFQPAAASPPRPPGMF
ncbi:MAG: efflux RND transporter periplasmic adaptor subunit [Thermoanaerobaculaceae bacterium]|nr:efflux RND transporter periplasmic adaptor subunit [Thermoanaerobaculaceae bacterium]